MNVCETSITLDSFASDTSPPGVLVLFMSELPLKAIDACPINGMGENQLSRTPLCEQISNCLSIQATVPPHIRMQQPGRQL